MSTAAYRDTVDGRRAEAPSQPPVGSAQASNWPLLSERYAQQLKLHDLIDDLVSQREKRKWKDALGFCRL